MPLATAPRRSPSPMAWQTAEWDRIGRSEVELPHAMDGYESLAGAVGVTRRLNGRAQDAAHAGGRNMRCESRPAHIGAQIIAANG